MYIIVVSSWALLVDRVAKNLTVASGFLPVPEFAPGLRPNTSARCSRLVARGAKEYFEGMKTLTVQEANQDLSNWLRRAASGEQIAINDGDCTVLLQPLSEPQEAPVRKGLSAREALRQLQARSRLTAVQAEDHIRELRAERLTDGRHKGQ